MLFDQCTIYIYIYIHIHTTICIKSQLIRFDIINLSMYIIIKDWFDVNDSAMLLEARNISIWLRCVPRVKSKHIWKSNSLM